MAPYAVFACILCVFFQLLGLSAADSFLNLKLVHPALFNLRDLVQKPKLDPRIKIFLFDDATASKLKSLDLPLATWGKVISRFSEIDGVHVIIDKVFDLPFSDDEVSGFVEELSSFEKKTSVISFVHPSEIPYRKAIPNQVLKQNQELILKNNQDLTRNLEVIPPKTLNVYGARSDILEAIGTFGHANYEGDHEINPFLKVAEGVLSIHVAFSTALDVVLNKNGLTINQKKVPQDSKGRTLIDFAPKSFYLKNAYSFLAIVERTKNGKEFSVVNPGDFVVILPAMYTGNTDFRGSPFGPMSGGYHIVALLQSALSGKWLSKLEDPGVFTFLLGILSFLAAYRLRPIRALLLLPVIPISLFAVSGFLFVLYGIVWSFAIPALCSFALVIVGISLKSRLGQIEELRIQRELEVAKLVQDTFFKRPSIHDEVKVTSALKIDGRFRAATECGGDWWGSFHKNGYTYVFIGDAIGHGVPAALVTAVAFSVVKTAESELAQSTNLHLDPVTLMAKINLVLVAMKSELACMTFFCCRIDDSTGECVFANAGNQQPILVPKSSKDLRLSVNQRIKPLSARGDFLGLSEEFDSELKKIQLIDGDKLAFYTDGIIENRNATTLKQIGRGWLKDAIQDRVDLELPRFCDEIWKSYLDTVGSSPADDDSTFVVLEFRSPTVSSEMS